MLTKEAIKQSDKLKDLSDDAVSEILTLHNQDLKQEKSEQASQFWENIDNDVEELTGTRKANGEKSYAFLKEQWKKTAADASRVKDLNDEVDMLKSAKSRLEQQVKDGKGDQALKDKIESLTTELNDAKAKARTIQDQLDKSTTDHATALSDKAAEIEKIRLENEFSSALPRLNFKDAKIIDETTRGFAINGAKSKILEEYEPSKDAQGNFVWRKDGEIALNPDNGNKPYTTDELMAKNLSGVLQGQRKATGTGQAPSGSGNGVASSFSTTATNKVQARRELSEYLVKSEGLVKGTPEFTARQTELDAEHELGKLPMS